MNYQSTIKILRHYLRILSTPFGSVDYMPARKTFKFWDNEGILITEINEGTNLVFITYKMLMENGGYYANTRK